MVQLVRTLADEERTSGVRVNAVAPTRLRTEANVASISGQTRYIELDEFSRVVLALCGVAGARVTGNVVELS